MFLFYFERFLKHLPVMITTLQHKGDGNYEYIRDKESEKILW